MSNAVDHYERLLAEHYTWMLGGDITTVADSQLRLLRDLGVRPSATSMLAVDLGCGPGPQSLALAGLGFSPVLAVDTNRLLLEELTALAERTAIRPIHTDIRTALTEHTEPASVAAVVCMGDTLTHLPAKADVLALLRDAARCLVSGGHLVLTYRDLTRPLTGTDRFVAVRSSDERIMTCFLEYVDDDTVVVHDLIHTRSDGTWIPDVSSYPKLRISPAWITDHCRDLGLDVRQSTEGPRGLHIITAAKP